MNQKAQLAEIIWIRANLLTPHFSLLLYLLDYFFKLLSQKFQQRQNHKHLFLLQERTLVSSSPCFLAPFSWFQFWWAFLFCWFGQKGSCIYIGLLVLVWFLMRLGWKKLKSWRYVLLFEGRILCLWVQWSCFQEQSKRVF